jgi:hypothetical protein
MLFMQVFSKMFSAKRIRTFGGHLGNWKEKIVSGDLFFFP